MIALLLACAAPDAAPDPAACDPRTLAEGEVRARQIPCSDELIAGGEGRSGDWLLENAYARYVVRGTYAALTVLGQEGGTLVDAATPGGTDLLAELVPDGDRTSIVAENDGDEARLVLPGVTYRLGAEDGALRIEGTGGGTLLGRAGVTRTGGTLGDGEGAFFGVDGAGDGPGGRLALTGLTRAAVTPEALWPEGTRTAEGVDADGVVVLAEGRELYRAPVIDGAIDAWVPAGASVRGEREGCVYDGLTPTACGYLRLRVADDTGADLPALVADGRGGRIFVPKGGGLVPVGPDPRDVWVWAGPRHSAAAIHLPGGDTEADVRLHREVDTDDVLGALAVEVAPDAGTSVAPRDAGTELTGEGVGFAVLIADDEVPTVSVDVHDPIVATAGSRAGNVVFSWPWSPNGKRPAHGAAPWEGLGALDLLALVEGGRSAARLTVVTKDWIARARTEADPLDWAPRPDAVWIQRLEDDLDPYLALLDDWVDVAPVGPRTWIGVDADRNLPACERGIVESRTSAGNGPRVVVAAVGDGGPAPGGLGRVSVTVDAPRWMGIHTVTLHTDLGAVTHPIAGPGAWKWATPAGARWVVAVAEGRQARPGEAEAAWAVSAPLWLASP